ncbi:nectin-1-like isoform X2 [Stegostoma tigrinum]|uniref:nectin-1-like isoform X2 n=1 Tax=Stegostoma tigrinum TaxID=3053191 RepID=UPI0028700B49|nr:nectin-1-like isoform X2 [Stegostoma tigrinum]
MSYLAWKTSLGVLLLLSVTTCVVGERAFLTAMAGTEVLLPCWPTANNTNITQFSWTKDGQEKPVVVYNLKYGPSVRSENYSGRIEMRNQSLLDGSIRIKALKIQDEGNYMCEITLFPQGAEKKGIHLTILVIPTNAASSIPAEAGLSDAPVAQCTSAFGNPAAEITWKSSLPGKHTMIHVVNDNNMVTVHSNYTMTPHRSDNGQTVTCQVTHSATSNKTEYPVQLSILYRPVVTITGYDGTWSVNTHNVTVTCSTDANPEPTNYTWRGLPEGVEVKNAQVFIGEESALENGNWTCEAANTVGIGVGRVEVVLRSSNSSDTDTAPERTPSQAQDNEMITYASLDLNVPAGASVYRQNGQAEDSTVYADIKYQH